MRLWNQESSLTLLWVMLLAMDVNGVMENVRNIVDVDKRLILIICLFRLEVFRHPTIKKGKTY